MDARGGRVVFVAHCLLNQNTRYLGGAVSPGVVWDAVRPYVERGDGLVQLPCPEQHAWGGVLKRRLLWLVAHPYLARSARLFLPAVRGYTRRRYRRLARAVAADVADYSASGMQVNGIVGVAGSPSCGVDTTLDLMLAVNAIAHRGRCPLSGRWMDERVVQPARCRGRGMFTDELVHELRRRRLEVPLTEQDL